jgi:hypothetical protein
VLLTIEGQLDAGVPAIPIKVDELESLRDREEAGLVPERGLSVQISAGISKRPTVL